MTSADAETGQDDDASEAPSTPRRLTRRELFRQLANGGEA